jgi:hypothetical protein
MGRVRRTVTVYPRACPIAISLLYVADRERRRFGAGGDVGDFFFALGFAGGAFLRPMGITFSMLFSLRCGVAIAQI